MVYGPYPVPYLTFTTPMSSFFVVANVCKGKNSGQLERGFQIIFLFGSQLKCRIKVSDLRHRVVGL